jgi:hypothetical protein
MIETYLDVEVHCLQPRWVADEHSKYRLYINDELLTERDWIWAQDTYIHENMLVEVPTGLMHTVRVEVIKSNPMYLTQLALRNLNVNGVNHDTSDGHRDNLSFMLA